MDTVTPGIGVKAHIELGYVYSDGTTILGADDKAGISAIIDSTRPAGRKHSCGDVEVITVGEETGLIGQSA